MTKKLILAVALSLAIIGGSFSIANAQCCFNWNPCAWFSCGCGCARAAVEKPPVAPAPQYVPPADRDIAPAPRQDLN